MQAAGAEPTTLWRHFLQDKCVYCPAHFQEDHVETLISLIEQFPLATIVGSGPSGLVADHIPLLHEPTSGSLGRLIGHVARPNPLWQCAPDQELLIVFQGPSTYISPNWYLTKQDTGKVVPTWNYAVVHAHCTLTAIHDQAQILQIITKLTDRHEADQAAPWRVTDAPQPFVDQLLANIVGIELTIRRMQGKWKVSQNQPPQNQRSVLRALLAERSDVSSQMALLVDSRRAK